MPTFFLLAFGGTAFCYLVGFGRARLRILLLTAIFLLPFFPAWRGIQLASGTPLLNVSKLLLVGVAAAWLVRDAATRRARHAASKKWRTTLLVLASFQALSFVVATDRKWALITLGAWIVYYYVIYLCTYDVLDSVQQVRQLILVLASAGTLVSVAAIWESITGVNLWHGTNSYLIFNGTTSSDLVRYGFARASGAFPNYLSLGTFLGMVWPLWLVLTSDRTRSRRVAGVALACLGIVGTWATVSRGPILGTVAAIFVGVTILASTGGRIRIFASAVASVAVLMLVAPGLANSIGAGAHLFVSDAVNPNTDPNAYARIATMRHDLGLIASHPLLGFGIGEATRTYITGNTYLAGVRSLYITMALDSGVLAVAMFLYFILGSLRAFVQRTRAHRDPQLRSMYLALSLAIISVVVTLASIDLVESLTYLFALIAAGHRLIELDSSVHGVPPLRWRHVGEP